MKKKTAYIVLAVITAVAVVGVSGYLFGQSQSAGKKTGVKSTTSKSDTKSTADSADSSKTSEPGNYTQTVSLYFSDSNAQFLTPEKREISVENKADIYQAAVKDLVKGPVDAGHFPTLPAEMDVAGVTVNDGTAQVDMGATMNDLMPRGTTEERMFVYSIVNTLTEFPEITRVRFLAGGATPVTPDSRINWTDAFVRNEAMIRK